MDMTRGYPRPRQMVRGKDYPVPYTSPIENGQYLLDDNDHERVEECHKNNLCVVCGESGDVGYAIAYKGDPLMASQDARPIHQKCAKLSIALCPHLNDDEFRVISYSKTRTDRFEL